MYSLPFAETFSAEPIFDLIEMMVSGFVTAWRFAASPTMISPFLNDTTEGVVRLPSGFAIIFDSFPSRTATAELVVPKSIPMILDMFFTSINLYLLLSFFLSSTDASNRLWRFIAKI
ncbi:Uncharacterised protein [Chlamydia trachomatis]|nr:Uncharacterised protein [Chlamydia trachomatis]